MKSIVTIFLLILFFITELSAGIIHVPEDQPTIQAGINAALKGDTVLVSEGTFYENVDFIGKAIIVASYMMMDNDTTHRNNTIINGSQPTDPSKGSVVSFISGEDTTSVIYGFTITGGTGTLYDSNRRVGGGIYCGNSGARIIHNKVVYNTVTHNQLCLGGGIGSRSDLISKYIIIKDNFVESNSLYAQNGSSGGGIFLHMQGGSIIRNKIRNNFNSGGISNIGFGGGIAIYDNIAGRYMVKIIGNSIMNNEATSTSADYGGIGGGIDVQFCDVLLLDNQITHNVVSGAKPEGGAGVRLIFSSGSSMAKDNTFSFNTSVSPDSVLWGNGGGLEVVNTDGMSIRNNWFEGNESAAGSGVSEYSTQGTVISGNTFLNNHCYVGGGVYEELTVNSIISGNRFTGNEAGYYGGGIMITDCSPGVYNNLIVNNKAVFNGGGIYLGDQNSEAQIINNTIVTDTAGVYGGGICSNSVSPVIMNTIIWGNFAPSGEQIYIIGGNTQVVYCDVQGGWTGEGNRDIDPLFVLGDTLYRLTDMGDTSMCLNTGIGSIEINGTLYEAPETDFAGNIRPQPAGTRPDMGAWESDVVNSLQEMVESPFPNTFILQQNYPNPFNPMTTIEFQIPTSQFVTLKFYNLLGQEVATLVSEKLKAGNYKYTWDGGVMASGLYLYKLQAGDFVQIRKMLLIR